MKSTQATIQARVHEVLRIRLEGAGLHEIRQYASEQDPPWDVSDRQLRRYIAASDKLLARSLDEERDHVFNLHLGKRRAVYAQAMKAGDLRTALAELKDEAELLGLYSGAVSEKEVAGLATQLVGLVCRRLPPEQHAGFEAEVRAILNSLEVK